MSSLNMLSDYMVMPTKNIKEHLKEFLKDAKKVAILCIGNPLRGDDSVGIYIGRKLKQYSFKHAEIFLGYHAPENVIFQIIDGDYSHVIIIDAGFVGEKPGEINIVDKKRLPTDLFTTHYFALGFMVRLLEEFGKKVLILTIRPKMIDFHDKLSKEVKDSADYLIRIIVEILQNS